MCRATGQATVMIGLVRPGEVSDCRQWGQVLGEHDRSMTGSIARSTLDAFYAAEAAYLAAGGPGKADFAPMAACLTPEVTMYQAESLPYGGIYEGPEGIERFMAAMSSAWSALEFLEQRFVIEGDAAVVYNHGRLTARSTGKVLETSVMQLIVIHEGLIAEIRPFYLDTAAVVAALTADGHQDERN
jgi:ketosteroid isomerase-like protein